MVRTKTNDFTETPIMKLKETENSIDSNLDLAIYKLLFDSMDAGFCIIEMYIKPNEPLDYKFIEINRAFAEQATLIDAKGKWMRELRPDHEEYWFEIYRDVALTGKPMRTINKGRALKDRWFSIYAFRIGKPEELKVAVIFTDITTQKLSEEKDDTLRKSEERLRLTLEALDFGTWELDLITGFLIHTLRYDQIFGYKELQNDWTLEKALKHVVPEDRENVRMALESGDHREKMAVEARISWDDGSIHWIHLFGRFQYNEISQPVKIIGLVSDITKRKIVEEQLKENEERLLKLNASKDKFFSILSHDLKSPFTSIIGFSDLLIDKLHKADFNEADQYAKIIQKTTWNTYNLLTNLFDWSRMQAGSMKFKLEEIDLISVTNEIIELFRALALHKSITVVNNITAHPKIQADKTIISIVLRNLISNAIKFSFPGEMISISSTTSKDEIFIEVKDNGTGMTEDTLSRLFKIDKDISSRGTLNEEGTGLGLILCKEFIEKHGGKIWAESENRNGSRFLFTLPLKRNISL
jgi:two-component system, sensor histidine kinase and response regulator